MTLSAFTLNNLASGRITTGTIQTLLGQGKTEEVKELLEKHVDSFTRDAWNYVGQWGWMYKVSRPEYKQLPNVLNDAPELKGITTLSENKKSSGAPVGIIQHALQRLGDLTGEGRLSLPMYGTDLLFGTETTTAVKFFQATHGLTTDGIVGPNTLKELSVALAKASSSPVVLNNPRFANNATFKAIAIGGVEMSVGASDKQAVAIMQQALVDIGFPLPKKGIDGLYGPETKAAVTAFQAHQQLPQTGKLDRTTLAKLNEVTPWPGMQLVLQGLAAVLKLFNIF